MKRLFNAIFVALMSAAFIMLSSFLLQKQSSFYEMSQRICTVWKISDSDAIQRFCVLIRYLITLTPLIWAYYFSVLLPRRKKWNTVFSIWSILSLVVGTFLALLLVPDVYYAIFSKICYWEIDIQRSRIPILILNLIDIFLAMFISYKNIYGPSIAANSEKWITSKVFLRSCGRYGSILLLAHFVLFFAVSAKEFLFNARLANTGNYLAVAEADSHNIFGILFLLLAEPLLHEIAFRGLIFEYMKKYMKPLFAAIVSSFLYIIWYWNTGLEGYVFFLGLLLCFIYQKGLRLRYTILLHMLVNLLKINFFTNGDQFSFGPIARICAIEKQWVLYAAENSAFILVVSAAGITALAYCLKRVPAEK